MNQFRRLSSQRGTSLFGLLVMALVVGFIALMLMRTFPSINEYLTIRKTVAQIMRGNPSSVSDIRTSFDKATEVEFSIKTIGSKDLTITPLGEGFRTTYAYDVQIPIVEPVFLLVKYAGGASSGGGGGTP